MCHLLLDVSASNGNLATVRPNQMCVVTANGTPVPGTVNSGTLTLAGAGSNASFEVAGNAASPLGGTCAFTATGMSAKTPAP